MLLADKVIEVLVNGTRLCRVYVCASGIIVFQVTKAAIVSDKGPLGDDFTHDWPYRNRMVSLELLNLGDRSILNGQKLIFCDPYIFHYHYSTQKELIRSKMSVFI